MSISPTTLKIVGGTAAALAAGSITFVHGQQNDATPSSGDQTTWNKKVLGATLTTAGAALGAAMIFATKSPASNVGAALGVGVLFGGIAGSVGGFLGSIAID